MGVEFRDNSKQVLRTMDRSVEAALIKIGIAAKRNVKEIIKAKDIMDTEQLHDTFDYNARVADKAVDIGSEKNYAIFNELGTSKMAARPFLRPGIMDNMDEYKGIVKKVLGDAFGVSDGGMKTTSKYYQDDDRVTNI